MSQENKNQVLISACCLGLHCRYHGRQSVLKSKVKILIQKFHLVPVCPEQLGGLPTPRPYTYWENNKLVFRRKHRRYCWDLLQLSLPLTDGKGEAYPFFQHGAKETLRIAKLLKIKKAYFLKGSPSCDPKEGICSKLLKDNGIKVYSI